MSTISSPVSLDIEADTFILVFQYCECFFLLAQAGVIERLIPCGYMTPDAESRQE